MALFAIALAALVGAAPASQSSELTVAEVKALYENVFALRLDEQGRPSYELADGEPVLPSDHPLADLVNGNEFFFLYLVRNWSEIGTELSDYVADAERFPDNFYADLREDGTFNSQFLPIVARFLEQRGDRLVDFEGDFHARDVSLDRALDIAARFFYPDGVHSDGSLTAHVCVGINGMLDLEGGRDPYVEALAYLAINKEMAADEYGVVAAFLDAYNEANSRDLSHDNEVKVIRAQGIVWAAMHRSEALRELLLAKQAQVAPWLPIRIQA